MTPPRSLAPPLTDRCSSGKRSYTNRRTAKEALGAAGLEGDHMRPYVCPECSLWHVGHLPRAVLSGVRTADEHYGRNLGGTDMTTHVELLNATRSEVEEMLIAGKAPAEVVRELQEPMQNVLVIYRDLRNEGRLAAGNFAAPPSPAAVARVAQPPRAEAAGGPSLLARAERIDDKKIKATLGKVLDLFDTLDRLVEAWEAKAEARADVDRLTAELEAAKAKLRGDAKAAKPRAMVAVEPKEGPACPGCGKVCANNTGLAAHKRHCEKVAA